MSAEPLQTMPPPDPTGRPSLGPIRYLRDSVRGKLAGIVLLTTVIVLLIAGVALLVHDLSVYRNSWAVDVAAQARILAQSAAPAMAFDDRKEARRSLEALQARPAIRAAALYTAADQLYAQFARKGELPPGPHPPAGLRGLSVSGERVEFAERIEFNGENLGTLYVRAHYDVLGRINAYLGIFAFITGLSLVAALFLSAALQRLVTIPLEAIGLVARQIVHQQDYSLRVEQMTNDEIGLAVQALNRMLDEVQIRARALEGSNESLRREVAVRKRAEAELGRANARLESTMAAAEIGGWALDLRTHELVVDHNFAALYGFSDPAIFMADPTRRLRAIHRSDAVAVAEAESRAMRTGTLASKEFRIVQPDGTHRWCMERGKVQRATDGRPVRLAGLLIDVTAQMHAEQQRRETERVYRAIGESLAYGVWITDAEGRCTYASESFLRLLGMSQEQCSDLGWASLLHPEERDATLAAWGECVLRGDAWYREHRILGADGSFHPVLAQGVPIRREDNTIYGWAGINLDISPLKHTEEALREADRRKDEFLATLAHELRNPLAPIRHAARILDTADANEPQRKWAREVIARQVEHMALLLDDLLDVSRITRGRLDLKLEPVSLERIVHAAVETSRPLIDAKRHDLSVLLPDEPIELMVDSLRMAQALSNLLTNAAKYTDAEGTIVLSARREVDGISIKVNDTGIGLDANSVVKVFEMFSQVETAIQRSEGGLGIGLALVKGLVALHGGSVHARSDGLGLGSSFAIHLPEACIVEQQPRHQRPSRHVTSQGDATARLKVLVADDNRDAADSLAMLLQLSGHEVFVATTGRQALELARRECPDVLILDIGMPELSGYEVARAVRDCPWGQSALLIALTGWGQQDDIERARSAGFDRHYTKPIDTAAIEALLAAHARQGTRRAS